MTTMQDIIKEYDLKPHPEGGFFRESYRAAGLIPQTTLPAKYNGNRSYSTCIYYLLPENDSSHLHRLLSDEIWHFYLGGPLTLLQISPQGHAEKVVLGQDIFQGQKVQHVVPAGYWFGAKPDQGSGYSFVGCTVAPGFDFKDFELADIQELTKIFPHLKEILKNFS